MASLESQIRDAIVTAIGAAELSQTVTVAGVYDVTTAAEDVPQTPSVFVYPGPRRADLLEDVVEYRHLSAYVTVLQKLPVANRDATIDGLIELTNEIETLLSRQTPIGAEFVRFENGEIGRATYNMDAMRDHNTFEATVFPQYGHYT